MKYLYLILKKKNLILLKLYLIHHKKVTDTKNYENYNEYEISLDSKETKMTNLFLKNKKLLNNELIGVSYNNEVFSNELNDLSFNFKFGDMKINLRIDDKVIFNYIIDND